MKVLSNQNLGQQQRRGSNVKKTIGGTTGGRRVYFFSFPTGKKLIVRHNLDVMHIEKNICDRIIGTLLRIDGKCKDSEKARLDMQHLGIRQDQHLVVENGKYTLPPSLYSLDRDQKKMLFLRQGPEEDVMHILRRSEDA
jgi:hypothetical protein